MLLRGYADRVELDDDGRVVVVDLKTGKYPPTDESIARTRSSALYQHAVNHGAVDDLPGWPGAAPAAPSCGSCAKEATGQLKVQQQQPQPPDDEGARAVERQLIRGAAALRLEEFPARPERAGASAASSARSARPSVRVGAVVSGTRLGSPADLRRLMGTRLHRSATSSGRRSARRSSPPWSSPAPGPARPP